MFEGFEDVGTLLHTFAVTMSWSPV